MIVQELVAQLGFQVDKKGVVDFDKTVKNFTRTTLGAAKNVGLAFVGLSIFEGMGLEKAERQLEAFTNSSTLTRFKKELQDLNEEFTLVSPKEATKAAATIARLTGEVSNVDRLIEAAGKSSIVMGGSFEDAFGKITSFIQTGDIDALRELNIITAEQFNAMNVSRSMWEKMTFIQRKNHFQAMLLGEAYSNLNTEFAKAKISSSGVFEELINNTQTLATLMYEGMEPALVSVGKAFNEMLRYPIEGLPKFQELIKEADSELARGTWTIFLATNHEEFLEGVEIVRNSWDSMVADFNGTSFGRFIFGGEGAAPEGFAPSFSGQDATQSLSQPEFLQQSPEQDFLPQPIAQTQTSETTNTEEKKLGLEGEATIVVKIEGNQQTLGSEGEASLIDKITKVVRDITGRQAIDLANSI